MTTAPSSRAARAVIVDYGLGNLFSISRALQYVGAEVLVTEQPEEVQTAQWLVLPGVGAFGDGMEQLQRRGLIEPIHDAVRGGCLLLGICLGMQLLFTESEEFGSHRGLDLVRGRVRRLRDVSAAVTRVKVPHIGWSALMPRRPGIAWSGTVLEGLVEGDAMYFIHSYVPEPEEDPAVLAQFTYGGQLYCAVIEQENVIGFQCHPEKSGAVGLQVLRNFLARAKLKTVRNA